ncbi:unnamed protein product [Urochloa humidicola]
MASLSISPASSPPWHLQPEVLRRVIIHLPFPADRARFRAVCRAWRSAAGEHVRQLPWIVFPDASFCTIAGDDGDLVRHRIPGLPENTTCLGAAADGWLALDCTDDVFRRTPLWDKFCYDKGTFVVHARRNVRHAHAYMLHNPFSGETVPLPELDSIVGDVAETFEIRKVLMRSTTDDVIAVVTNNWNYNIILCRPGKGLTVLDYFRVIDVEFHGGWMYGITPEEDLLSFHLGEDNNGRPIVTRYKRVIKHPLADDKEDLLSWMDYDDDDSDDSGYDDNDSDYRELPSSSDDEDGSDYDYVSGCDEEEVPDHEDDLYANGGVPESKEIVEDDEAPHDLKDYITTTRRLFKSRNGEELLMLRHRTQVPPYTRAYTRKVEVFKADIEAGVWVPIITGDVLPEGEALFHSRSFCKSTRVYGDIKDGFIYTTDMDDVLDTRAGTCMRVKRPPQWRSADTSLLTWVFPPKLVV